MDLVTKIFKSVLVIQVGGWTVDNSEYMTDEYDRPVTNLRISVTTNCDLNCFYCHEEGQTTDKREMTVNEIERISRIAKDLNIRKIKLTGGEPLVRSDIIEIIEKISPHMEDTSLTTNGVKLSGLAKKLSSAGLDRVNISLDTLNPEKYETITGKNSLQDVKKGIEEAIDSELYPIKLNSLIMKGKNDDEIWELIEYASHHDVILQLIELETDREGTSEEWFKKHYYDLKPVEKELRKKAENTKERRMHRRKKYYFEYRGGEAEVEVVRPMHNTKFCMGCTRLRMTSDGQLKTCLLTNELIDIIGPMRKGASDKKLKEIFKEAVSLREPYWQEKKT